MRTLVLRQKIILLSIIFFVLIGNGYAIQYYIERPKLGMDLSYEYEKDRHTGPFLNTKDTTTTFSERLNIETRGWVYHPAMLIYTLRFSPEWEQLIERGLKRERRSTNTFLGGYFTELIFLQYKPYTLDIYGERQRSTIRSSFAGRSKKETDNYGGRLMLKYRILPTIVSFNHIESRQTGFYKTDNFRDELDLTIRHYRYLGSTTLNASYIDNTQITERISLDTREQTIFLRNIYELTEDKTLTLNSNLNYDEIHSSNIKSIRYTISENLYKTYTQNLSTSYIFNYHINNFYDRNNAIPYRTETKTLGFNLNHTLYENLLTSFSLSGSSNQFSGARNLIYGGELAFNYKREIPWGLLGINIRHGYNITETDLVPDYIQVIDERIVLSQGRVTLLANKYVDLDSIEVTDETGLIIYEKDRDYRIEEINSFVRISCVQGWHIPDCSIDVPVLVDYRYRSNPPFDYSTFDQLYGINLDLWSAWRLYYIFERSRQKLLSGIPPEILERDIIRRMGTEFEWRWSRTTLELEDTHSTSVPIKRWRAEEVITLRPSEETYMNLSVYYGKLKFKDTQETERFSGTKGNLQILISNWGSFKIEGSRGKISGPSEKIITSEISSTFEWYYNIWQGNITLRFLDEKDEINNERHKNYYALFEIKRSLF